MFSPAFVEMYEETPIDSYNPSLAKKLLEEAGYGKNGRVLELDWKISNNKASIEVAEVIQHYFEKAGIKVNLSIQEWGTYMTSYKNGKFDVVVAQWVGFSGPDMLSFAYHSNSAPPKGGNRFGYKNAKVDLLLEQGNAEINNDKRTALFKKAQEIINNDYAVINLWHPNIIWIGSPCLKNVELVPTGSFESLPKVEKNCDK
jgi:peptide/nickel transport system substrate-binding protein